MAWSLDLFRKVGLVLFAEQFVAACYGIGLALTFIQFRFARAAVAEAGQGADPGAVPWYDWLLAALSLATCAYVFARFPTLTAMSGQVTFETLSLSIILTVLTVDAVRRTIGWSLVIILLALALYVIVGHLVPGRMQTRNVQYGELLVYLNMDNNGLLGLVLQITVIVIIPFVLMGQLLMRSGGSGFFNDIAIALMGRYRGGPAKMAVVGSSLFGMISGVAAANTVAVGVVTIPLMRRSGMPAKLAAAVEACASNGGQLMPPVMGAVAFVMADFLQIPYKEVAIAAILPSVMYYAALFIQADLEAARYGFGKVDADKIPAVLKVLKAGWLFLVPFVALVYTMFWLNLEPEYCAMVASVVIIALGFVFGYDGHRMTLRDVWQAVVQTAGGLCEILVISAAAGFIMALFQVSGLAFAFAAYLVDLGGQSLILLLMLAAVVSIILGMGLPTIGVYIMLAILVAPALVKVGVPPLAAHLFILYFGMMSLITPPVAPAAYVAAAIAGSPSMATGWTAMRFGWSSYIVPFIFVYAPAMLMKGSWTDIIVVTLTSLGGIWLICAAMVGFFTRVLPGGMRILFAAAGIMLLLPHQASSLMLAINLAGLALGVFAVFYELRLRRHPPGLA
ncbi:MAG TPA: TRAP transporter fused permease subunit [Burkholderiales bacterium]|nr:TRAP transporter fused permease subunit [Burkholderiales bacterium]